MNLADGFQLGLIVLLLIGGGCLIGWGARDWWDGHR